MGTEQFRDDDQGYLSWVASHAHGYVINIQRSLNPADARTHHASCGRWSEPAHPYAAAAPVSRPAQRPSHIRPAAKDGTASHGDPEPVAAGPATRRRAPGTRRSAGAELLRLLHSIAGSRRRTTWNRMEHAHRG
jgi:hypothetical protein